MKTLNELLDENLEVIKLTRNPSTFRGRKVVIKNFKDAFATLGFTSLDDLNSILSMARFTKELGNQIANGEWGSQYSTNSQRYHTGKAILVEIGVEAPSVAVYINAKKNVLSNGSTEVSIQETITSGQIERLMAILDEVMAGREIKVKGSVVSPRKVAMGNLYLKIAAPYALRQGSIMDLRPSDFTYENLTYRIQKGENKGMPVTRPMNNMTWDAYEQYLTILGHRPEKLFNDASWLSAFVKVVMTEAGVEAHHGRHGIHRFRRALVTWAYNNNKMVEHFSPALDHKNTEVTENVYIDLTRKQQKANQIVLEYQGDHLGLDDRLTQVEQDMAALTKMMRLNVVQKRVSADEFDAYDESHKSWLESIGIDQNAALFHVSHDYGKINEEYQQRKELLGRDTSSKKDDDDDYESGAANYSTGSGDPPPHSSSSLGAGTTSVGIRVHRAPRTVESLLASLTVLSHGGGDSYRNHTLRPR